MPCRQRPWVPMHRPPRWPSVPSARAIASASKMNRSSFTPLFADGLTTAPVDTSTCGTFFSARWNGSPNFGSVASRPRNSTEMMWIAIDPAALPTIELSARILTAKGRPEEAVAELEKAFATHKSTPNAMSVGLGILQLLMILKQDAAAERIARELAAISPKGKVAYAEFLASRNRTKEAREQLDTAFKTGAAGDVVRSAIALASTSSGWISEADGLLSVALKGQPDSLEFLQAQAYLRHIQRRYEDEILIYKTIINLSPSNYVFMNNMAWTLSEEMNKPEEGLERANEALKKLGYQPHVLDTRGVIYLRLKKVPEAIKDLEAAVAAIPSGPIFYHLFRAYSAAGRTSDAETFKKRAKEAGLSLDQLQPSEREEAAKLLDLKPLVPAASSDPGSGATKTF